ncbi:PKD-like domain-containing protein [Niabella sp.]|uniref:PKD-like domain-containing protein n=1 Tax=Niabella sp. TaxID=1962976 RepID=UPI0026092D9E|nr:PKD-like domain-containing protein [Niabella sp.]
MKQFLFFAFLLLIAMSSCKKDKDVTAAPVYSFSVTTDTINAVIQKPVAIESNRTNGTEATVTWMVDGKEVSSESAFTQVFAVAGFYKVFFKARNEAGVFEKEFVINVAPVVREGGESKYISRILEYAPAPGQFINVAPGNVVSAEGIVGKNSGLVTLGAYGGYITFTFDHSIQNKEGADIAIYGNPLKPPTDWSEPGIVMVSRDDNGNGIADDAWYELAGSEYNSAETIKHYSITYYNPKAYANVPWKDNLGNSGAVEINAFHKQQYYPLFAPNQDSLVFTGTLLKSTFGQVGGIWINAGFSWGYADSYSSGDDYDTNKYNAFDISRAVDDNGKPVQLKAIDFVKVYTAQNNKGNALMGEISTEIKGAEDLHFGK